MIGLPEAGSLRQMNNGTTWEVLFDDLDDTVSIGAMRTCSQVPRSFSRTIDSDVETTALIMTMKPMRPGTRNSVLWSSGLYQIRGSTAMGGSEVVAITRPAPSSRAAR